MKLLCFIPAACSSYIRYHHHLYYCLCYKPRLLQERWWWESQVCVIWVRLGYWVSEHLQMKPWVSRVWITDKSQVWVKSGVWGVWSLVSLDCQTVLNLQSELHLDLLSLLRCLLCQVLSHFRLSHFKFESDSGCESLGCESKTHMSENSIQPLGHGTA